MQRAVHLSKLRGRTPDTSKQSDFFITTDTIRANMGEPLFLHFLTANKRLNLVLPFLKHLDKCVSSCLTHVLSYWIPYDLRTLLNEVLLHNWQCIMKLEVSVVLPYWSPQRLTLYAYSFSLYVQQRMQYSWHDLLVELIWNAKLLIASPWLSITCFGYFFSCFRHDFFFFIAEHLPNYRYPFKKRILSDK